MCSAFLFGMKKKTVNDGVFLKKQCNASNILFYGAVRNIALKRWEGAFCGIWGHFSIFMKFF